MSQFQLKDDNAILDYKFDFAALANGSGETNWLSAGETITGFTITASTGITVASSSLTNGNTSVTYWLSGGTAETIYTVTCHITTSAGRQDDRSMYVTVAQR